MIPRDGIESTFALLAGALSAGAARFVDVGTTYVGIPLAGIAACFFGALFGIVFLPVPQENDKKVPPWLALFTLWGVGVFLAAGLGDLLAIKSPVGVSMVGLVISACPIPIVRGIVNFITKRVGGTP